MNSVSLQIHNTKHQTFRYLFLIFILANAVTKQDELKLQMIKFENLKNDFSEKEKEMAQLKKDLEEKTKSLKEVSIY